MVSSFYERDRCPRAFRSILSVKSAAVNAPVGWAQRHQCSVFLSLVPVIGGFVCGLSESDTEAALLNCQLEIGKE